MTEVVLDINLSTGVHADRAPKPAGTAGALIGGRRTYDTSLPEWGAGGPHPPTRVFVLTHEPPKTPPTDGVYTFVTDGIHASFPSCSKKGRGCSTTSAQSTSGSRSSRSSTPRP